MTALKNKPKATKCSDYRTISRTKHTAKSSKYTEKPYGKKIEQVCGEDQFEYWTGKGTMGSTWMVRTKSERALDIDDKLCACFIDGQKALVHVNWAKLILWRQN